MCFAQCAKHEFLEPVLCVPVGELGMLLIRTWSARMTLMRTIGDTWVTTVPGASAVERRRNLGRAHYYAPLGECWAPVSAGSDLRGRHRGEPSESGLDINESFRGGILSEATPRWGGMAVRIGGRGTPPHLFSPAFANKIRSTQNLGSAEFGRVKIDCLEPHQYSEDRIRAAGAISPISFDIPPRAWVAIVVIAVRAPDVSPTRPPRDVDRVQDLPLASFE
jgi:hypothetical protein